MPTIFKFKYYIIVICLLFNSNASHAWIDGEGVLSAKALLPISSTIVFTALIICPSKIVPVSKKKLLLLPLILSSVALLYKIFNAYNNMEADIHYIDRFYKDIQNNHIPLGDQNKRSYKPLTSIFKLLKEDAKCAHLAAKMCHENQSYNCKSLPEPSPNESLIDFRGRVLKETINGHKEYCNRYFTLANLMGPVEVDGKMNDKRYRHGIVELKKILDDNICKMVKEKLKPEYYQYKDMMVNSTPSAPAA